MRHPLPVESSERRLDERVADVPLNMPASTAYYRWRVECDDTMFRTCFRSNLPAWRTIRLAVRGCPYVVADSRPKVYKGEEQGGGK